MKNDSTDPLFFKKNHDLLMKDLMVAENNYMQAKKIFPKEKDFLEEKFLFIKECKSKLKENGITEEEYKNFKDLNRVEFEINNICSCAMLKCKHFFSFLDHVEDIRKEQIKKGKGGEVEFICIHDKGDCGVFCKNFNPVKEEGI